MEFRSTSVIAENNFVFEEAPRRAVLFLGASDMAFA